MAVMGGKGRKKASQASGLPDGINIDPTAPTVLVSQDGTKVTMLSDGSAVIGNGGIAGGADLKDSEFSDNLADEKEMHSCLSQIAADLLDGIDSDIRSRQEMVSMYVKGIDMLGLKIEDRSGKRQRKNVSTIRHPMLLEAVIKFQSAARAELLPAAGPCKVMNDGDNTQDKNDLAQALENDINHYLTTTATEFYFDTDRGLFYLGYGGTIYKKIYNCPIRRRPVSECIYLTDLIVSENTTDLDNAIRVTHKIEMTRGDVKRMQHAGAWRKAELTTPSPVVDQAKQKIASTQGLNRVGVRPKDQLYTIYECYCELIPEDYGFTEKDVPEGLPVPYRVTIDKDSQTVLDIRRIWKEGDENYKRKLPFVMYGLVPGLGFLCLGFLHILGNQTRALTAIWRILIDAGMFSTFPGGVRVKGTRQTTNEINPGPGEWPEIDTGPIEKIQDALMPLPYKEPSQVLIEFSELIASKADKLGSSMEMQTGEGRTNIPVGTMMAMIEQQTQIMQAVHKRLHTAQKQEMVKLKELFAEDPESLYRSNPRARQWQAEELKDLMLVPASDPNVPAQTHRIMQSTALITLSQNNPDIYDKYKVHKRALRTIGINDAQDFLHPPVPQQPQQDPRVAALAAQTKAKEQENQIKMAELQQDNVRQQREAADRVVESQQKDKELQANAQNDALDRQSKEKIAQLKAETEKIALASQIHSENKDRQHDAFEGHKDRSHDAIQNNQDRQHEANQNAEERKFSPKEF